MKILHYINNLGSGGAEKLLTDILPIMKDKGHEVGIILINGDKNVPKYDEIMREYEIPVFNLDTLYYNPLQIFKLISIIKKEKPDIVHAHLFPSQYWLSIASIFIDKKIDLIKTEHNVHNRRMDYKFLNPIEKFIYEKYSKIIGITTQVTTSLSKWIGNEHKIVTIENGVNLGQVRKGKNLPLHLNLKNENFNILMVGRFDGSQKDQKSLIESLKYLPSHVHLYFAGEGESLHNMQNFAASNNLTDRVHFLGLRQDVYTLMSHVDLNVLSTNHEGLSGVALESMASGKPFIGSNVKGVNNIVPNSDFLFPAKNSRQLADKILKVIEDKQFRDKLVQEAENHISNFDITHMTNRYLNLYEMTRN